MSMTAIQAELEQIQQANGGVLIPEQVVAFAENPETALHSKFEWDDTEAARQYRLHQARNIINVCVTVLPQTNEPVRAFVSLVSDRVKPGGGYRATESVMSDEERRAELLDQALRELASWQAKYNRLSELGAIFAEAEKVRRKAARRPRPQAPALATV